MLLHMRFVRRLFLMCRTWLLLLLLPFLGASLPGCGGFHCEAVAVPPVIPILWAAGGQMYLYSYGARTLYALRASDGKKLWQASGVLEASEADQFYIKVERNNSDGPNRPPFLEALQASTGEVLWRTEEDSMFQVVGSSAQSVLLSDTRNGATELAALDASTGSLRWNMPLAVPLPAYSASEIGSLEAQVQEGIVYLRSIAGALSAYDEASGALLWNDVFPIRLDSRLPWFIGGGVIYLSADHLYALRASDGATLWQADPATIALDPDQGVLYTLSLHHLTALRAQDGQVLWTRVALDGQSTQLKLIDGMLYSGSASPFSAMPGGKASDFANGIYANRTSDGQALWFSPGDLVAVAGAGETVYLLSYEYQPKQAATMTALRAADGTQLWHQRLTSGAGLVYADGALYTGYAGDNEAIGCTATGSATAAKLRPSDGTQLWHFQAA